MESYYTKICSDFHDLSLDDVCMYVCMYVCIYIYNYICIYRFIYIHTYISYKHIHTYMYIINSYSSTQHLDIFLQITVRINRILIRFQGHYQDIKTNNDTTVARHFNECITAKEGQPSDFSISVLSFIHQQPHTSASQLARDTEEKRWMNRLGTILPQGLNLID